MNFKEWLEKFKEMNLKDDYFIHFTPLYRAKQILKDKKLLLRPPYKKFGTDYVNAVSTTYGRHVPEVQTTHIKEQPIVAILFQTDTMPDRGYPEEVTWEQDVILKNPKIISKGAAVNMLAPYRENSEDYEIKYY